MGFMWEQLVHVLWSYALAGDRRITAYATLMLAEDAASMPLPHDYYPSHPADRDRLVFDLCDPPNYPAAAVISN